MAVSQPRYSKEEFARRGDEIYEHDLRPHVEAGNEGKFIVIDIETGAYEIDADELVASDRLLARHPDAQVWLRRVGSRYARRSGSWARLTASVRRQHFPGSIAYCISSHFEILLLHAHYLSPDVTPILGTALR